MPYDTTKKLLIVTEYVFDLFPEKEEILINKNMWGKLIINFFGNNYRTKKDYENALITLEIVEYTAGGLKFKRKGYNEFKNLQKTKDKLFDKYGGN